MKHDNNIMVVLSSPSGAGKTTITKKIQQKFNTFKISVSHTTRKPRPNEVNGVDYNFVSLDTFKKLISEKKLYEHAKIFDNYYGTSKETVDELIKTNDLILMFQKELAEKIIGKSYGRLSIIANFRLKLLNKFNISPNCFYPRPKVDSTILHLMPINRKKYKIDNLKNLENITNIFFSNKRKMIKKNLNKIFDKNQLKNFKNLDLNKRPADLKPEIYYKFTEVFEGK